MKNLVITIPSKGRLYGESFNLISKIKNETKVYLYVDETEKDAYEEEYPNLHIVTHNYKTINEIRLFIQKHQHDLDNNMIMMDDDIISFKNIENCQISFNQLLNEVKEMLDYVPFVYFYHEGQQAAIKDKNNIDFGIFTPASVVCLSPDLYKKGIRYNNKAISEDFDFYFQLLLNEIEIILLPYFIFKNVENTLSHFTLEFRNESIIETYLKYGDVIDIQQNYMDLLPKINGGNIKKFKKHGATYVPEINSILASILINKFPGYELLVKWKGLKKIFASTNTVFPEKEIFMES